MPEYNSIFKPAATSDLVRLGSANDGGYVIPERILYNTKGLLSFGLCDDWKFEADFHSKVGCPVVIYDPSVDWLFWTKRAFSNLVKGTYLMDLYRISNIFKYIEYRNFFSDVDRVHIRKAIGYSSDNSLSLNEAIVDSKMNFPIFLKIDIEGWEYRILEDLNFESEKLSGIAIEFHDIDLHEERIAEFIVKINKNMVLVHFHPNTQTQFGPEGTALAVEMTFMNRNLLKESEVLTHVSLPIENLDSPSFRGDACPEVSFKEGNSIC